MYVVNISNETASLTLRQNHENIVLKVDEFGMYIVRLDFNLLILTVRSFMHICMRIKSSLFGQNSCFMSSSKQ